LGDYREKVGVVAPSGNNVLMKMTSYSSASDLPLIHADVKAMTACGLLDGPHCLLCKERDFSGFFLGGFVVGVDMAIRAN
jgi:hypothetical protein